MQKDTERELILIGMDFTQVMRYASHLVKKKLVRPCKDNKENLYGLIGLEFLRGGITKII